MDEQPEPTIDLASVTKTVAETDRRRALVEEELTQAQTVVEALRARSLSLEESVLELQRQLDATRKQKRKKTPPSRQIVERRRRAIDDSHGTVDDGRHAQSGQR